MTRSLQALGLAVVVVVLAGCRGDGSSEENATVPVDAPKVIQDGGQTAEGLSPEARFAPPACVLDDGAPAEQKCIGVFASSRFVDGQSGQFVYDSLFGADNGKERQAFPFARSSNIGLPRPASGGGSVFLNLRASADARRHTGLGTITEGTAYVTLRVRTEPNKPPDTKYRLSTRGPGGETPNALREYFVFVAKPLGDIGTIDSSVPFPVARLEVYGFAPGSGATLRRIAPDAEVFLRQCPHARYGASDRRVRAAFLKCKPAHDLQAAADESGFDFDVLLTALEQRNDTNPFLPSGKQSLMMAVFDMPDAGAWFTCATGCCTSDYLF